MKKIIHYLKKNIGICMTIVTIVVSGSVLVHFVEADFQVTDPYYKTVFNFPGTFSYNSTQYFLALEKVTAGSNPLSNGKYDAKVALGVFGTNTVMDGVDDYVNKNFIVKIKKKGTITYLGLLEIENENITKGTNGILKYIGFSSFNNGFSVDPGEYAIDLLMKGQLGYTVADTIDICLPSFDPDGPNPKIGNITCGNNSNSQNSYDGTTANGTNNPATSGNQPAQGGNSNVYTVTIGNPVFIKGANNDIAQFNIPLLYKLPADPTNKTKINGSLQTVIYKKNELKKVEESAPFGTQNVLFNTQSMWSYQWTGLTTGNEYVVYFYDKTTNSKSSYISLKYGADGKLIATVITVLPSWTANVSVPANGGVANPTSINGLTFSFLPDVYLQKLKAKGSVKFTGANSGTLGGTIILTPVAYNGTKLPAETFTLPSTAVESGNTYPLEFTLKQTIPVGVSINKIEIGSSNASITPRATAQSSGSTDVITGVDGKKTTFSITKAEYDASKKTIALVGNITYTDDFVATNKYNKILADIYSGGTKTSTKNIIFTKTATGRLDFNSVITDVDPSKKPDSFKIRDTSAEVTSKSFSIPTGTGQGNNSATQTSGLIRFSAKSTTYTGTTVSGSITPTVQGNDLKIKGELTYFRIVGNPAIADVKNAGRISFHLIDGENKVSQIKVDQLADGIPLEYDLPYQFEVTFPNYNRYLDQEGVPTNLTIRPVPFKVQIIEDQLSAKSEALTVVTTAQQTNNQGTTDSLTASDGTKVKFAFNSKDPVASGGKTEVMFDGSVTYSSFANTSKLGKLQFVTYDKSNKIVKTESLELMQSVIDENIPQAFTESLSIDSTNGPFTLKIKDTGLGVESKAFALAKTSNTNNNASVPQTSSLTVSSGEFKGKKVDISVTSSKLIANANSDVKIAKAAPTFFATYAEAQGNTQPSIKVDGSVKYNDFGEFSGANTDKIGKIKLTLKGKSGVITTQDSLDIVNQSGMDISVPVPFTTTFSNIDKTQSPFTVEITEKDLGVTSSAFRVAEAAGDAGDTNGDGIIDENDAPADDASTPGVSQNRISLGNPLKDGLDSIPAIVAVLVRDIVIPIAVPFLALAIIYTGFLFVQARGNAEKLKEAKAALKWTLIGGAIILGAYVIATALQATIADIVR
jgi:hypothetical protein